MRPRGVDGLRPLGPHSAGLHVHGGRSAAVVSVEPAGAWPELRQHVQSRTLASAVAGAARGVSDLGVEQTNTVDFHERARANRPGLSVSVPALFRKTAYPMARCFQPAVRLLDR